MSTTVGTEQATADDQPAPERRRRRRWLSWTIVALLALWAAIRVGGLEQGSFVTQLMTVTPYGAVLAALTGLLLIRRNRPAALVAALACVVMAACVAPRLTGADQPVANGAPLRVLTINLFGRGDAQTVVDLVRRYDVDVFTALELTPGAVERLDMAGLKQLLPHRVLQEEFGATGSGIYARHPVTELTGLFTPIGHNMPAATMALPGGSKVEIVAVHPNPPLGRMEEEWNAALRALPPATPAAIRVLAGDFNASLDHRAFRDLLSRGYVDAADQVGKGLVPTWPNFRAIPPIISIDHVVADRRVSVRRVEVSDVPRTDHRAVFAELRLP
ncbi:endonuclease/exonuclease/phosphatase family protein [Nonomuraea turkmeniaca]|uniref:Endonuclease/exonuclease/phosphatase family protein n=1 Tax=Nonomuraea turkmeniaca TaxID=103838 RepID=A0A5S4FHF9_9ACTN|nr:endonuclease/exonuclease/phosphatase family protein [Nonomuraea turkmeniaca]TMR08437.1 endonuclease/exonuclease/phosphatase family protein [Nonomuraea turkmeniaca]